MSAQALAGLLPETPVSAAFNDAQTLALALRFESALAEAQARVGLLPAATADAIASACAACDLDPAALAAEAAHAGTLAIPLVAHLRAALAASGNAEAAAWLHHSATSQDLADTALMAQARQSLAVLDPLLARCENAAAALAHRHAATPAMARTLLQDALPISLGLRFAQWRLGIIDAHARLTSEAANACVVQLGGPVGTLGGMQGEGEAVTRELATAFGLGVPTIPWHARRGAVAGLGGALAILVGTLAKVARDTALMMQPGVGEAAEPQRVGRGGSSAMPHKRNPTLAQHILAAAARAPGLAGALIGTLPQEFERGLGGWQAERPLLIDLFTLAGVAAGCAAELLEGLAVDTDSIARRCPGPVDLGESERLIAAALGDAGAA